MTVLESMEKYLGVTHSQVWDLMKETYKNDGHPGTQFILERAAEYLQEIADAERRAATALTSVTAYTRRETESVKSGTAPDGTWILEKAKEYERAGRTMERAIADIRVLRPALQTVLQLQK